MNRARALALATALALLAAAPDSAATGALAQLSHLAGKPATGLTFSPIGATPQPLAVPGKPTVVIAFASWCFACMDEMPRNLADYARYKDRVTFLGIDYMDGDRGSAATIEKYAIPFPIERDGTANPPPTGAAQAKAIFMMALPGVTPKELPGMANTLKSMLPPEKYAVVADVVAHCATLSDDACTAYAKSQGLTIGGPVETPDPAGDAQVSLPTTFVLDANGVVVKRLVGYDVSHDDLAAELDKLLGAPAAANP